MVEPEFFKELALLEPGGLGESIVAHVELFKASAAVKASQRLNNVAVEPALFKLLQLVNALDYSNTLTN